MDKMQVDNAQSDHSSSISSPPNSPRSFEDTINVARPHMANSEVPGGGVVAAPSATSGQPTAAAPAAEKAKAKRKKKEVGPDGKPIDDGKPKEKKPRKPRAPKDPNAANGTAASRKKVKTEPKTAAPNAAVPSHQSTLTDMAGFQSPAPQAASNNTMQPQLSHTNNTEGVMRPSLQPQTSTSTSTPPASRSMRYDPVRGATIDMNPPRPTQPPSGASSAQASPHMIRATASPSIAIGSLIDPPTTTKTGPSQTSATYQPLPTPQHRSPTPPRQPANTFAAPPPSQPTPVNELGLDGDMDIDSHPQAQKLKPQQSQPPTDKMAVKAPSSSSGPTPKPNRPTPPPAPKGTGSGLLSSSDLFGGPSNNEPAERRGVNIDIQIKLNPNGGNTINIAQEIFKKYGRDAINPRAAAHRERLLQVAAAQNKIDGGSGADGAGEDLMSDVDGDNSNVEMGGMDADPAAPPGDGEKPRKRRKKVEEYDKEDDFIDDTELAWQEQAAVAKDGFFVYSGPLVPAEPARPEAGTTTRGGRGRGRGRGRAGAAAGGATHASLAEKKEPAAPGTGTAAGTGRGRGRGRGTGAPRKPRITKADRERMENEKRAREEEGARGQVSNAPPANAAPLVAQGMQGGQAYGTIRFENAT